jgi:hypothetical protein
MVAFALNNPACEHVIHQPFAVYLTQGGTAYQACTEKHLMCRLENTLEVRGISLGEGKLLREVLERDSPGDRSRFARDFQQTIKSPGDWTAQRLILR